MRVRVRVRVRVSKAVGAPRELPLLEEVALYLPYISPISSLYLAAARRGGVGRCTACLGRYAGDVGEIHGRYTGDMGEIYGRYTGDIGEMRPAWSAAAPPGQG